jgi:hypothetical protein
MLDPHTSMPLAAVLVLTVVVLVTVLGWLAAVFLAGRQPRAGSRRPGREERGDLRGGDMPARARAHPAGRAAGRRAAGPRYWRGRLGRRGAR